MNDLRRQDQKPEPSALILVHESEINQQIATAKAFPRTMGRIISDIDAFATHDEDTAVECVYALKRGGKEIVGPSVRFAEIVATCWGNARYASRIIDEGPQFITAEAVFHDLEKNTYISVQVPRRITNRDGNRYDVDMIGVTANAAMSIALRNAILKGVPKAAWGPSYAKCLAMIQGTFESIEKRRTAALLAFQKMGVDQGSVLALLELNSVRDIEPEDMVVLRGTLQAVRDGDTTLNAVFGQIANKARGNAKADVGGHLDRGRENGKSSQAAQGKGSKTDETGDGAGTADQGTAGDVADSSGSGDGDADRGGGVSENVGNDGGDDRSEHADPRDGGDGRGSEDDQGDADGGEASAEPVTPIPEAYEGIMAREWTEKELSKLGALARALGATETAADVSKRGSEFLSMFESGSAELESAYNEMIAIANKAARSKRGGSAASKL